MTERIDDRGGQVGDRVAGDRRSRLQLRTERFDVLGDIASSVEGEFLDVAAGIGDLDLLGEGPGRVLRLSTFRSIGFDKELHNAYNTGFIMVTLSYRQARMRMPNSDIERATVRGATAALVRLG